MKFLHRICLYFNVRYLDEDLDNTTQLDSIKEESSIEFDAMPKENESKYDSCNEEDTDFPDVQIKIDYSTLRYDLSIL